MGPNPPAKLRPDRRAALVSATLLGLIAIALAAPGPELVPGAGADAPGWILGPFGDGFGLSPGAYLGLIYAAIAAWVALCVAASGFGWTPMRALAGAAILLFALAPPLLSLDLFSYIAYARLGTEHGLNPYEFAPAAIPGDEAASRVEDFRDAVSVYGPLFTLGSYPLGALGAPAALWSLKAVAALSVAGVAALTARLASTRGVDPRFAVAFVALNPLVLIHVVGGGHNDGLMMLVAMAAIAATLTARPLGAGLGFVCAGAIKATGGLAAPFAVLGSPDRGRLLVGIAAALAVLGGLTLVAFGPSALEALGVAGDNQATVSRWSVPGTLARVGGIDVDVLRALFAGAYVLFVIGLLVWTHRGADWVRAAGWAAAGLLVASAWLVPWYLIWLLPLAAISRDRALIALSVALTVLQAINAVPV